MWANAHGFDGGVRPIKIIGDQVLNTCTMFPEYSDGLFYPRSETFLALLFFKLDSGVLYKFKTLSIDHHYYNNMLITDDLMIIGM